MARSIALLAMGMFAMFAVASAQLEACSYNVTRWRLARYKLGAEGMVSLEPCESGFTSDPDWTQSLQISVLTQTLVEKIWPSISGDDADIYLCDGDAGGVFKLGFDQISSCIGNNARNPREANVGGFIQYRCRQQARIRSISVRANVQFTKTC